MYALELFDLLGFWGFRIGLRLQCRRKLFANTMILRACAVALTYLCPAAPAAAYDSKIEGKRDFTRFDAALTGCAKLALAPHADGPACCAIELMGPWGVGGGRGRAASRLISRFSAPR